MATALVTGASAGLGEEFVWQLAVRGHDVVVVARNAERLTVLAQEVQGVTGVNVEVLPADLATEDGLDTVVQRLLDRQAPVSLLVNNAGFGLGQRFIDGEPIREESALQVMVRAVLVLSRAAVEPMLERGHGAILNIASVAALLPAGTYAAHKSWVRTFTEALAVELEGTPVTATVLCPGLTRTEFHARAGYQRKGPTWAWLDADAVVSAALRDVALGKVISTPSLVYKLISGAVRLSPRTLLRTIQTRVPALR